MRSRDGAPGTVDIPLVLATHTWPFTPRLSHLAFHTLPFTPRLSQFDAGFFGWRLENVDEDKKRKEDKRRRVHFEQEKTEEMKSSKKEEQEEIVLPPNNGEGVAPPGPQFTGPRSPVKAAAGNVQQRRTLEGGGREEEERTSEERTEEEENGTRAEPTVEALTEEREVRVEEKATMLQQLR